MKRLLKYSVAAALVLPFLLSSCGNSGNGQLIGVQNRIAWYQPRSIWYALPSNGLL